MQVVSIFSSIKTKLWLGFALVLSLFSISTAVTLISLNGVNSDVEKVVTDSQPTLLLAKDLTFHIEQATASLGFFMVTKEEYHLQNYTKAVKKYKDILQELRQATARNPEIDFSHALNSLREDIGAFEVTANVLQQKTSSFEKNFPGIDYANQHINPINRTVMQLASQMILAEMDEEASEERKQVLVDLSELRYSWSQVINGVRGYLAFRSSNNINNIGLYMTQAESLLQNLLEMDDLLTLDQYDSITGIAESVTAFKGHYAKLREIHGGDEWRSDAALVRNNLHVNLQSIQGNLSSLVSQLQSSINQTSTSLRESTQFVFELVIALFILGLTLGIAISWFIAKSISKPIMETATTMQNIADGDGNLMITLDQSGRDELAQLAGCFNVFVSKIRDLIKKTAHSTESVIESVAQTSDNTNQIIKGILNQEVQTEQVATAMSQMTACISDVAKNASIAEHSALTANKEAHNGCTIVRQTSVAVKELADEVKLAEESILNVEQESLRIGGVLDVIKSIAEQTNLLALNAAIEAARAGEQGRGFAVVADEVRSLATRTHESTGEIENMIQSLQNGTQEAVSVMSAGRDKVNLNVQLTDDALKSLGTINQAVETISEMNTQIATAAEQQCTVAEEINKNICSIKDSSKLNADEANATATTVNSLGNLASTLQSVIQQFKFSGDSGLDFSAAKSAHLAWKARLRSFLDGMSSLSHEEAVSHHDCVLGKWYYSDGLDQYGDIPEMRSIEKPHHELHELIKKIIEKKESGHIHEAEALYTKIAPLSSTIINLLEQVERSIDHGDKAA
ncbi:MAG: methyl-accepting chemotaxis protein [Candidatus Thiodiazotropha taylori]